MSKRVKFRLKGHPKLAKPYRYKESGLSNIYLTSGVTIENTDYGRMVSIEQINELHRAIGLYIIEKEEPMNGAEFRFLRKQMDLTQPELAKAMKISDQTIANYEKSKTKLQMADPMMRFIYLLHILPDGVRAEVLKEMIDGAHAMVGKKLPSKPRRQIAPHWVEKIAA